MKPSQGRLSPRRKVGLACGRGAPREAGRQVRSEVRAGWGLLPPRSGGFAFGSTIGNGYGKAADGTSRVEKFLASVMPLTHCGP